MFIVAVTRWGPDRDACLPQLAEALGLFAYDLRMRLAGPLPVVVAKIEDQRVASELMAKLRGWGHGAIGCDPSTVPSAASMHTPRDFSFEGGRLHTRASGQAPAALEPSQVLALIHAMTLSDARASTETTSTRISPLRAAATGGMIVRETKTSTTRTTDSESEERVYLIRRSLADPISLRQHSLNYTGLGEQKAHASMVSFSALVTRLRAFAPHALYDRQLVDSRRKSSFVGASRSQTGDTKQQVVSTSNVDEVDLAAHLILIAHLRGQL